MTYIAMMIGMGLGWLLQAILSGYAVPFLILVVAILWAYKLKNDGEC